MREAGHLRNLPSRGRYIVEILDRLGTCTFDQLQRETGLTLDRLEEEMRLLEQQGMILALSRDDEVQYRTTT